MQSPSNYPPSPTESIGPPSYELSVAEKQRLQKQAPIQTPILDEDGFPIYDAEVFEAVANSYQAAARTSSHSPAHAKHPTPDYSKARPRLFSVTPLEANGLDDAPPPFSPAGTSSAAFPFERSPPDPSIRSLSRPNSPLVSPPADRSTFFPNNPPRPSSAAASRRATPSYSYRPSLPSTPQARPAPAPRPPVSHPQSPVRHRQPSAYMTRLEFDPNIAYADTHRSTGQASAFYNPLIAAHMPSAKPTPSQLRTDSAAPFRPSHQSSISLLAYPAYPAGGNDRSDTMSIRSVHSLDSSRPFSPVLPTTSSPNPGRNSRQGAPSQWATSEAQLFQHLYGR